MVRPMAVLWCLLSVPTKDRAHADIHPWLEKETIPVTEDAVRHAP
jgi:hypothetical protein